MLGRLIGFWGGWDLQLKLIQLLVGQFLVSDVGSDHFLIPTNGGDKVSARPEFVAEKSRHLAVSLRVLGRFLKETSSLQSRSCKTSCFRPAIGGGLAGLVNQP